MPSEPVARDVGIESEDTVKFASQPSRVTWIMFRPYSRFAQRARLP